MGSMSLHLFKKLVLCAVMGVSSLQSAEEKTPEDAFKRLREGNQRFVNGGGVCPENLEEKRESIAPKQTPFALIIGCSDARVPPEIIFDQGLGDLFIVRVAGNVIGPIESDSIDFSVDQLKTNLIVVLGHQSCGAVDAVLQGKAATDEIKHIAPLIQPAVDKTKNMPGDHLVNAIKANVMLSVKNLQNNPQFIPMIQSGKLKILGAYYQLQTGKVEWLDH